MKKLGHLYFLLLILSILGFYFILQYSYKNKINLSFRYILGNVEKMESPPFENRESEKLEKMEPQLEDSNLSQQDNSINKPGSNFHKPNQKEKKYLVILLSLSVFISVLSIRYLVKSSFGRKKLFSKKRKIFKFIVTTVIVTILFLFFVIQAMGWLYSSNRSKPDMKPPKTDLLEENKSVEEK